MNRKSIPCIRAASSRRTGALCLGFCLIVAAISGSSKAFAEDSIFINSGAGTHATAVVQLGVVKPWPWQFDLGAGWRLSGAWEFNLETLRWNSHVRGRAKHAYGIGFSPLLRVYYDDMFFLEGTVGAHLIENAIASGHLGTTYEFGDMGGFGIQLTPNIRVGYRFLHFSNAGIKGANGGINLHLGRIEIKY